jgi:flavin-dependent dehydrogenase
VSTPSRHDYDAVVVGGRVAGATVASLLGERGLQVLLVERVRFPSTTISTHFFRGAGLVGVLDRLGVLERTLGLGCPPLRREWTYGLGSAGPEQGPPQDAGDIGFGLSVRRAPLDNLLLEHAARSPGVELAQPASVTGLVWEGDRVAGVRLTSGGWAGELRARIVIGADGRRSLVAREVEPPAQREAQAHRTLYYRYVGGWVGPDGEPPDAPEFSLHGDELAYVFPSDGGLACIAISAPRGAFERFRADPVGELDRRFADHHPGLAARVRSSTPAGRAAGGSPEPGWVRKAAGPGWALVGDAGAHQDPWTGEGMDNAAICAAHAADSIGDWLCGQADEHEALARYQSRRDERVMARFEQCTALSADLSQLTA